MAPVGTDDEQIGVVLAHCLEQRAVDLNFSVRQLQNSRQRTRTMGLSTGARVRQLLLGRVPSSGAALGGASFARCDFAGERYAPRCARAQRHDTAGLGTT